MCTSKLQERTKNPLFCAGLRKLIGSLSISRLLYVLYVLVIPVLRQQTTDVLLTRLSIYIDILNYFNNTNIIIFLWHSLLSLSLFYSICLNLILLFYFFVLFYINSLIIFKILLNFMAYVLTLILFIYLF